MIQKRKRHAELRAGRNHAARTTNGAHEFQRRAIPADDFDESQSQRADGETHAGDAGGDGRHGAYGEGVDGHVGGDGTAGGGHAGGVVGFFEFGGGFFGEDGHLSERGGVAWGGGGGGRSGGGDESVDRVLE